MSNKPCELATMRSMVQAPLILLAKAIYKDAEEHGLWDECKDFGPYITQTLAVNLISKEVFEASAAIGTSHLAEELADVIIMAMSAGVFLGIDIADEVLRKVEINKGRPYKHMEAHEYANRR